MLYIKVLDKLGLILHIWALGLLLLIVCYIEKSLKRFYMKRFCRTVNLSCVICREGPYSYIFSAILLYHWHLIQLRFSFQV
jgi:hypothetical protein